MIRPIKGCEGDGKCVELFVIVKIMFKGLGVVFYG